MFKSKYNVCLLDSKWNVVKKSVKLYSVPRRDEYIFFDGLYYEVLNVVHDINKKHLLYVIINEIPHQDKKI
jgi:hypothetical protein